MHKERILGEFMLARGPLPESSLSKSWPWGRESQKPRKSSWNSKFWEPARPLQRSLGPSGPEIPKKFSKMSQKASGPGTPKSLKKCPGDSPESLRKVSGKCLESVFGLSPGLFGDFLGSRGRRPRETFLRLFWDFGPGGPERPL